MELNYNSGSPNLKFFRQGNPWNSGSTLTYIGDLNGQYGYSTSTYGAAFGEYATNKPNITIDPTNGLRIRNYNSNVIELDNSGSAYITGALRVSGSVIAGNDNVFITERGIGIRSDSTSSDPSPYNCITFINPISSASFFKFGGANPIGDNRTTMHNRTGQNSIITIMTETTNSTNVSRIDLQAKDTGALSKDTMMSISSNLVQISGSGGLIVGNFGSVSPGDISYTGSLISYKNFTEYPGYIHVPLSTQLTNAYFEGNSFETITTSSPINMHQRFGVPKETKAVNLQIITIESGSFGSQGLYFAVGPSASEWYHVACRPLGGYVENEVLGWTSCSLVSGSPVIFCQIKASSGSSMKVYMRVNGYAI
jgi:hypothetical protein